MVITDIEIGVSDHISTKEKMILPYKLPIPPYGKVQVPLKFRTNFPGDATIGPISIGLEIDGKFRFVVKSERQDLKITSPRAMIGVNLKPLKTPVINQSFPVEVAVSNNSDGNALEVEVEFQFPEQMSLMRGTFKKQIYSLSPNEQFKWEITLKALDTGEIPVKVIVAFKDGDGNPKGPFTAELLIMINL